MNAPEHKFSAAPWALNNGDVLERFWVPLIRSGLSATSYVDAVGCPNALLAYAISSGVAPMRTRSGKAPVVKAAGFKYTSGCWIKNAFLFHVDNDSHL